jgi:hypothetical protein
VLLTHTILEEEGNPILTIDQGKNMRKTMIIPILKETTISAIIISPTIVKTIQRMIMMMSMLKTNTISSRDSTRKSTKITEMTMELSMTMVQKRRRNYNNQDMKGIAVTKVASTRRRLNTKPYQRLKQSTLRTQNLKFKFLRKVKRRK